MLFISCGKRDTHVVDSTPSVIMSQTESAGDSQIIQTKKNQPKKDTQAMTSRTPKEQGQILELINNSTSIDDLTTINPGILKDSKKDHPKFIEFQKKQMLLGMAMIQIQNTRYGEIQKKISDIYEAKQIWGAELNIVDIKLQKTLLGTGTSTGVPSELNKQKTELTEQKNNLIQATQKSKEFQEYIGKKQSQLDDLNEELKKYWTPEIIDLQKEVGDLSKEIYGTYTIKK